MKVIGKMIFNMDMERKFGQIIQNMKVLIMMERSMARVFIYGQMVASMMVIGLIIELKGMVLILG